MSETDSRRPPDSSAYGWGSCGDHRVWWVRFGQL